MDAPTLIDRFKSIKQDRTSDEEFINLDNYCVYVQNKKRGIGGGLSLAAQQDASKTPRDRLAALNSKLSNFGLDSIGTPVC